MGSLADLLTLGISFDNSCILIWPGLYSNSYRSNTVCVDIILWQIGIKKSSLNFEYDVNKKLLFCHCLLAIVMI